MTDVRGDHDEAERLYRKALELDPKHALHSVNYAEFLLAQGRLDESAAKLAKARILNDGQTNQLAAVIALHSAILAGASSKDDTQPLEELRHILSAGFSRGSWTFENVLGYLNENVAPEDYALYLALSQAILYPQKVPDALALLDQRSATAPTSSDGEEQPRETSTAKLAAPQPEE